MSVTCRACGEVKPIEDFYPRQVRMCGAVGECKECTKERVRKNRAANVEYYRKYDSYRFQNDPRVRERHRKYRKTGAYKESKNKSWSKWLENNPEKRSAHNILNSAVCCGKISKPTTCSKCAAAGTIDGHHHDYIKPLEVEWLCRKCHVARHKQEPDLNFTPRRAQASR